MMALLSVLIRLGVSRTETSFFSGTFASHIFWRGARDFLLEQGTNCWQLLKSLAYRKVIAVKNGVCCYFCWGKIIFWEAQLSPGATCPVFTHCMLLNSLLFTQ